ncbi:hypothetical protein Zmor_005956 [Zophobas morio]|uniref:DUF4806 domain-containing protein n=1 Tax=Zophobas morio TaxID=2755281 RepID=A0AA38ML09_9CUCU|nr:hypothetical protein Zmor_005956 [Zophobas morio]
MARAKVSLRQVGLAPKWLAPSRPRQVGRAKSAAPNSPIPLFPDTTKSNSYVTKKCRPITESGKIKLYDMLYYQNWDFIDDKTTDVDTKLDLFLDVIINACNLSFPEITFKNKKDGHDVIWFTDELKKMREHLAFLNELHNLQRTPDSLKRRNEYRRFYKESIVTAKKRINDKLIEKSSNKAKSMWNIINTGRKNKKSSQSVPFSAEEANDYFTNIAKNVLKNTHMNSPLNVHNMNMTTNSTSVPQFRYTKVGFNEFDVFETDIQILKGNYQNPLGASHTTSDSSKELIKKIPCSTEEELNELDLSIKNEDLYNELVKILVLQGGKNEEKCIFLIMKKILTRNLASKYSGQGKKHKLPFCNLKIYQAVIDGTRKRFEEACEDNIKKTVGLFLAQSKPSAQI